MPSSSITIKNNIPVLNKAIQTALKESLEKAGQVAEVLMTAKIDEGLQPPLKPATIAAKGSSTPLIDTGQLYGQITHEVESDGRSVKVGVIGSRASIAAVHEFGAPSKNIPERSFIRSTINEKSSQDKMSNEVTTQIKEAIQRSKLK